MIIECELRRIFNMFHCDNKEIVNKIDYIIGVSLKTEEVFDEEIIM